MHSTAGPGVDTSVAGWAREALARLTDLPAVRRVGLALAEGGGRRLRFTASDRENDAGMDWCYVDAYDDVPLNRVVRTGSPVLGALDDLERSYAGFVERQRGTTTRSIAAVPLVAAGQVLGGYVLFLDQPQIFDAGRQRELARLGADLGEDLRRAQRREERPEVAVSDDPVPPGAVAAGHEVPSDPAAIGQARRFLRTMLAGWGVDEETTDTALLCLSELVTNALVHAHTGCDVRVMLERGVLTTSVRDHGVPSSASGETVEDPLRVHGRGLQVVDALAARWGSHLDAVGTTVWFVLELE